MAAGLIGFIDTPRQGNPRPPGVTWCADNGCFGKGFKEAHWWAWLQRNAVDVPTCAFATAPDVPYDAAASTERSLPWLPRIRALGYPAAYVAQDGQQHTPVPWDEFDVLFIGGTDDFKLGEFARHLVAEAKRRGKGAHMGRVNSLRRFAYAAAIGCDWADGTKLRFGPSANLPQVIGWNRVNHKPQLAIFGGDA